MKATYVKTALDCILNISKIVTIHYYEFDKSFVFEGERHNFWEMVYVDRGKVEIRRDDEELIIKQGELIFHKPNEFHSIRAHDSAPNFFVISFECKSASISYFEKYRRALSEELKPFLSSILKEANLAYNIPKNTPSLKRLERKPGAPLGAEQLIKTYLEQLLILIMRGDASGAEASIFPSKESMETHLVLKIKAIIKERLCEPLRLTDICSLLGYSKSYLSRLFHEQTGSSISAYYTREKISQAKLLIREGGMNFSEISDRLNFDNPQYFSRVFRRVTGLSPTEFKASLNYK